MKDYQRCLCIGRFQPFHWGHFDLIQTALDHGKTVMILLGSSHLQARTLRNPWTAQEREEMMRECFSHSERSRLQWRPISDHDTNQAWANEIIQTVDQVGFGQESTAIVGCPSGQPFCQQLFPRWSYIQQKRHPQINATAIRTAYFHPSPDQQPDADFFDRVPTPVGQWLKKFQQSSAYAHLCKTVHLETRAISSKADAEKDSDAG